MVIKVCCSLELIAPETIAEQYHFDYLVAESICQNPPTPTPKIDEEKCSAFRYVSVLLKYRKFLPKSIIQALICLFNTPNNQYKNLLASYLGEVVLVCRDDIADIPEISQVLVSNLIDFGNKTIVGLFSYAIEKRFQIMEDKGVLLNLLAPLSQIKKSEKTINSTKALSSLLKTWPGFISFGVKNGGITNLVNLIHHETDSVISILKDLLKLDGYSSITDGLTGLLLLILLKLNLVEKLNRIASTNSSAASFLNEFLPYTSQSIRIDETMINQQDIKIPIAPGIKSNLIFFNLAKSESHQIVTINGFSLPQDPKNWDWTSILILLTVVLPHNDTEAQSQTAKQFYSRLFQFFTGPFLSTTSGKCSIMEEPLYWN